MIYINPANNTLMRYAYAYDAAGNITVKNTEHGNYAYGYDVQDRLTSATSPTAQEAFAYDKVGNRIKHNSGSPWAYNANNELTSRPAISYQYDANGSQIKKTEGTTVTDYIYDGSNRLSKVKQGATTLASYAYDPFGRRISKTVNGTTTYYYYSDEGLAAEADNTGAITQTYGYAPNSIWGTDPIYTKAGGSYHYYLNDHLGTPQQLALKNGAKTWSAVYEAFGKATVTTSTITNNLRFPGQYADSETGLHYNWNRTYDNQIGRYIKADPIGLNGGVNVFGYVNSEPMWWIDPLGLGRVCIQNTAAVYGFHQRIVLHTKGGSYGQSFGMANRDAEMQGMSNASGVVPTKDGNGSGIVYPDNRGPATDESQCMNTTDEQDKRILNYLMKQLNNKAPYNVATNSCRTYSQDQWERIRLDIVKPPNPIWDLGPYAP